MHTQETFPRLVPVEGTERSSAFRRDFNQHYAHLQRAGFPAQVSAHEAHTFALREEVRRGSGR